MYFNRQAATAAALASRVAYLREAVAAAAAAETPSGLWRVLSGRLDKPSLLQEESPPRKGLSYFNEQTKGERRGTGKRVCASPTVAPPPPPLPCLATLVAAGGSCQSVSLLRPINRAPGGTFGARPTSRRTSTSGLAAGRPLNLGPLIVIDSVSLSASW